MRTIHTILGLGELLRLGVLSRFRLRGAYWTWRRQTAWGPWGPPTRADGRRALLEYARWVRTMRRLR